MPLPKRRRVAAPGRRMTLPPRAKADHLRIVRIASIVVGTGLRTEAVLDRLTGK
jgi:hypothetical protein